MTRKEQINVYRKFIKRLRHYNKENFIKILKRGVSKEFAFERFGFDLKHNTIEQFAERLFFYGEKSKHFWYQKTGRSFCINDYDENVFIYIFRKLSEISKNSDCKVGTNKFKIKNKGAFEFFKNVQNKEKFINSVNVLDVEDKKKLRNYYFRIIRQLGETNYKQSSLFVSGTTNEKIAEQFSKNEIIINFWDFNFNEFDIRVENVPTFKGKPYKNQNEISIFGAIFPHYIHSFKYRNRYFFNPSLFKTDDFDKMVLCGFEIDQRGFESKLKVETKYKMGITKSGNQLKEIK
jgi:hypothetical protein